MHDKLTRSDIEKMEEEIRYRTLVVRKEVLEAVKEARAHGDLSENFEYKAAKQDKNKNERRIRYLENMIKTAVIVEENTVEGVIGLNTKVTVLFEDEDETECYKIVTPVRANSLENRITPESPVGAALMGHREGDRVFVSVRENAGYYLIVQKVENVGEEDTDTLRKF